LSVEDPFHALDFDLAVAETCHRQEQTRLTDLLREDGGFFSAVVDLLNR
jgi:hypothetical protein